MNFFRLGVGLEEKVSVVELELSALSDFFANNLGVCGVKLILAGSNFGVTGLNGKELELDGLELELVFIMYDPSTFLPSF